MAKFVLALDQGTTSSRSMVFDKRARCIGVAQQPIPQILPSSGHVEHDPEKIWKTQLRTARAALKKANIKADQLAAIGVTNQRETVVLWDRESGKPIDNAIVWQSRITAPICEKLKKAGLEPTFQEKTGLVLDPYFSGTKIRYLLDKHSLQAKAKRGEVLCGTIDTFLLWRLTGGRVHATDASNASRTLLFNIHTLDWDDDLLKTLRIPRQMLPEVRDSSGSFGVADKKLLGAEIPITGVAGDQQAATFGQACFRPGMVKNTYGTGCFVLMNTGAKPVRSSNGLLTTIGWKINGKVTYCLEGSVFIGGAAIQWLRDGLKAFKKSSDVESLSASVEDNGGVYFVPAMVGLGAPHWDPYARGTIIGIDRGTSIAHITRAAVESMAHQSCDLINAMVADAGVRVSKLRVDGGATVNNALLQFQADILGKPVQRPAEIETTALGAAYLAGLAVGYWKSQKDIADQWDVQLEFRPEMKPKQRRHEQEMWQRAVQRSLGWMTQVPKK